MTVGKMHADGADIDVALVVRLVATQFPRWVDLPIRPSGKTTTGIRVPDEVVESLGLGKRPLVRVTINGYTYRSTEDSTRGEFMLSVSAEVRERSGLDTEPREVSVPPTSRMCSTATRTPGGSTTGCPTATSGGS